MKRIKKSDYLWKPEDNDDMPVSGYWGICDSCDRNMEEVKGQWWEHEGNICCPICKRKGDF